MTTNFQHFTHVDLKKKTITKMCSGGSFKFYEPMKRERIEFNYIKFLTYAQKLIIKPIILAMNTLNIVCEDDEYKKKVNGHLYGELFIVLFTDDFFFNGDEHEIAFVLFGFNDNSFFGSVMFSSNKEKYERLFKGIEDGPFMKELIMRTKEIEKNGTDAKFKQYLWRFNKCSCCKCHPDPENDQILWNT